MSSDRAPAAASRCLDEGEALEVVGAARVLQAEAWSRRPGGAAGRTARRR